MTNEDDYQLDEEDDLVIRSIAEELKKSTPTQDGNSNAHTFLNNIVIAKDTSKVGNLKDEKDYNELGFPAHTVRGCKEMARISSDIMDNHFFEQYFNKKAEETTATSLSREGFIVKQATTQTKQVADLTKRRMINKSWFGAEKIQEQGGEK